MDGPNLWPIVKLGSGSEIQISTNINQRLTQTGSLCIKTEIETIDRLLHLIELTNRAFPYPGLAQGDSPSPGP